MSKKILYFGFYNPDYSRNRTLIKGFRENGFEVTECRVSPKGILRMLKLLYAFLKMRKDFDIMIVGFPGQEAMLLARFLTLKPIVFDVLTSHYDGYILDRHRASTKSLRAYWYRMLDTVSVWFSSVALLDTYQHIQFFYNEFGLPLKKFIKVSVGADDVLFKPVEKPNDIPFTVHFHGYFIPLQGTEYIIHAAHHLKNEDVQFQLIGRGQDYDKVRALASQLGLTNITWIDSVPYAELANYINRSDVCLGSFGDSGKALRVSLNKLFEYMACGKAIINGDSLAMREFLHNGKDVLFCNRADGKSLAEAILKIKNDPELQARLGANARASFMQHFTPKQIVFNLVSELTIRNIL